MTREQVHDLMENELRCVQRGNYCDRDCAKCPLVKEDKELFEAYGYVIKALEQEPTTKNCESCRYYGLHHEVCNYCYECSLWTEGEPTAKDDLTVDLISRADVIRAIEDVLQSDNCDYDLIEFLADLKDIPSVTPQEPKPMVEIDFYSVIKQKYIEREVLDKIRAEIETKYGQCSICEYDSDYDGRWYQVGDIADILQTIDKHKAESEG